MSRRDVGRSFIGHFGWFLGIGLIVITLDQLAKRLVVRQLVDQGSGRIEIGVPWLGLAYVENRGAAFGLLQGHSLWFLALATLMVSGIAVFAFRERRQPWYLLAALGLIAGGAVGNIIDRVRLGYVIDFVMVGPWPKFNLADAAITVGLVALVLTIGRADARAGATAAGRLETKGG